MKVIGLDGNEYRWPPSGKTVQFDDIRPRSELHLKCRSLLRNMYPLDTILEEVALPGSGKLSVDFFLPWRNIVVEVNGQQHYEYTPHFHGTRMGFAKALNNDRKKKEWCENNNITVISLRYDEDEDEWRRKIES